MTNNLIDAVHHQANHPKLTGLINVDQEERQANATVAATAATLKFYRTPATINGRNIESKK